MYNLLSFFLFAKPLVVQKVLSCPNVTTFYIVFLFFYPPVTAFADGAAGGDGGGPNFWWLAFKIGFAAAAIGYATGRVAREWTLRRAATRESAAGKNSAAAHSGGESTGTGGTGGKRSGSGVAEEGAGNLRETLERLPAYHRPGSPGSAVVETENWLQPTFIYGTDPTGITRPMAISPSLMRGGPGSEWFCLANRLLPLLPLTLLGGAVLVTCLLEGWSASSASRIFWGVSWPHTSHWAKYDGTPESIVPPISLVETPFHPGGVRVGGGGAAGKRIWTASLGAGLGLTELGRVHAAEFALLIYRLDHFMAPPSAREQLALDAEFFVREIRARDSVGEGYQGESLLWASMPAPEGATPLEVAPFIEEYLPLLEQRLGLLRSVDPTNAAAYGRGLYFLLDGDTQPSSPAPSGPQFCLPERLYLAPLEHYWGQQLNADQRGVLAQHLGNPPRLESLQADFEPITVASLSVGALTLVTMDQLLVATPPNTHLMVRWGNVGGGLSELEWRLGALGPADAELWRKLRPEMQRICTLSSMCGYAALSRLNLLLAEGGTEVSFSTLEEVSPFLTFPAVPGDDPPQLSERGVRFMLDHFRNDPSLRGTELRCDIWGQLVRGGWELAAQRKLRVEMAVAEAERLEVSEAWIIRALEGRLLCWWWPDNGPPVGDRATPLSPTTATTAEIIAAITPYPFSSEIPLNRFPRPRGGALGNSSGGGGVADFGNRSAPAPVGSEDETKSLAWFGDRAGGVKGSRGNLGSSAPGGRPRLRFFLPVRPLFPPETPLFYPGWYRSKKTPTTSLLFSAAPGRWAPRGLISVKSFSALSAGWGWFRGLFLRVEGAERRSRRRFWKETLYPPRLPGCGLEVGAAFPGKPSRSPAETA